MENILEFCVSSADQNASQIKNPRETTETTESTPALDKDVDLETLEKDTKHDDKELTDFNSKLFNADDESSRNLETIVVGSKLESKDDHKDLNIPFDEDIILPSVRHDTEQEQKQRDRIKRKEIKSRKELEEEEREKMQ